MTARLTTLILTVLLAHASATAQPLREDARGAKHPGWSLGLGTSFTALDLSEEPELLFDQADASLADQGGGGYLELGYAFSPDFALQARIAGAELSTGTPQTEFAFGQLDLDAIVYLRDRGAMRPYVAGGIGAAGIAFEQANGDSHVIGGGSIGMGAGLQVYVSRRWSLNFDYRFGIQNYESEEITTDGGTQERDVDLSGTTQRLRFGAGFSF